CTRARDHLVVSLHRRDPGENGKKENSTAWALADAGAAGAGAGAVDGSTFLGPADEGHLAALGTGSPSVPPRVPLPERDEWERERERILEAASIPLAVAATNLASAGGAEGDAATAAGSARGGGADREADDAGTDPDSAGADPGLEKDRDDSEQPPWSKGRYGTAVGRAVHGVLQDVDLSSGEGLESLADRQAAAEGVSGRSRVVAGLARAALDTAVAREAAASEHWRELFVAAPFSDRLVEGYIDLVYRGPDGLVVVDWKTGAIAGDGAAELARYRLQGAAYAAALEAVTGEPVARMVFVFLDPAGAVERDLPDLPAAVDEAAAAAAGLSG
ncbi:MAG: hypothetical protein F4046_02760, partial [Acidimicrobiaceae bacterium]|nr:hypothetical protein [Acidimicrobiaceae bacterium]